MGEQGAALQKYNQELVKCIEQLKMKRQELFVEIEEEDVIKQELESEIQQLQGKLDQICSNLNKKNKLLKNCDKSIKEAESAFMKILESSQVLLSKVLKESEEFQVIEESDE